MLSLFGNRKDNSEIVSKKLMKEFNKSRTLKDNDKICLAPFRSLLFIQSGDAKVCHYNRGFTLGRYPDSSVHDLWFGAKRKQFSQLIRQRNLSHGCHDCLKNINGHDYSNVGATKYDYLDNYSQESDYPVMLDFQLRNRCNLECFMCSGEYSSSIRANREQAPPLYEPWDTAFAEQLREFIPHLKAASFTGGEPMLIDIYYEIWDRILELNPDMDLYLSTNASVLPEKFASLLDRLKFNFTISIDSVNKQTYEKIRKNAVYETTIGNINRLHDYALKHNRHFAVKCCIIKQNFREFPDFFTHWNSRNIRIYPKVIAFPPYASMRYCTAEELKWAVDAFAEIKSETSTETQKNNQQLLNSVINQLQQICQRKLKNPGIVSSSHLSLEDLKKSILKKIMYYVQTSGNDDFQRNSIRLESYSKLLEKIYAHIPEEAILRRSLINIFDYPIEILISELERNSLETLVIRFKQAGQPDELPA